MTNKPSPLTIAELRMLHAEKRAAIQQRLREFREIKLEQYFYELAYCLLTPQSSAVNAGKAIAVLEQLNFFQHDIDPEQFLHQKEYYVRFHKTKAKRLVALKQQMPDVIEQITADPGGTAVRTWLVGNINGLGWKEASHFLRNIGYRNLAILDRHILKNLVRVGAIDCIPKSLSPKLYMQIEEKFRTFAERVGIPMDELDLLFWSMETGAILK